MTEPIDHDGIARAQHEALPQSERDAMMAEVRWLRLEKQAGRWPTPEEFVVRCPMLFANTGAFLMSPPPNPGDRR